MTTFLVFIRLIVRVFHELYQFVCVSFPFGFEGGRWDLLVLVLHSLSFSLLVLHVYVWWPLPHF